MGEVKAIRKQRLDKKRDIQPTIETRLYDCIARIAYICDRPIKDVGEAICQKGLKSKKVIGVISQFFHREFWWTTNHLIRGDHDRPPLTKFYKSKKVEKRRGDLIDYDLSVSNNSIDYEFQATVSQQFYNDNEQTLLKVAKSLTLPTNPQ